MGAVLGWYAVIVTTIRSIFLLPLFCNVIGGEWIVAYSLLPVHMCDVLCIVCICYLHSRPHVLTDIHRCRLCSWQTHCGLSVQSGQDQDMKYPISWFGVIASIKQLRFAVTIMHEPIVMMFDSFTIAWFNSVAINFICDCLLLHLWITTVTNACTRVCLRFDWF